MAGDWTWRRPVSLEEATGVLLEQGDNAMIVAGGTAVALNPPRKAGMVMVDLQALGLEGLEAVDGRVRIGAGVTAQDLVASPILDDIGADMLHLVGLVMGPRPVRNRITVGGNVMQVFRWCDLPVALLALDASFEIAGPGGATRTLGADEIFRAQPRRALERGELLSAVSVAPDGPGEAGAFRKFSLTEIDHALVTAAVRLTVDGAECRAARVVVGAVATLPQRAEAAEDRLVGARLDQAALDEAAAAAAEGCRVTGDHRADEAYRRAIVGVQVRRALETAVACAGTGGAS